MSGAPWSAWRFPGPLVTADDVIALVGLNAAAIDEVHANASAALGRLEALRETARVSLIADREDVDPHDAGLLEIDERAAELAELITREEATKVAALEAEQVAADTALAQLQDPDVILTDTQRADHFTSLGCPPLRPNESTVLFLVPADTRQLAFVCARYPRVTVRELTLVVPTERCVWPVVPLRFEVSIGGVHLRAGRRELQNATESLAAQLRVVAVAVPRDGPGDEHPLGFRLASTCEVVRPGLVAIKINPDAPINTRVGGWAVRVQAVYLRGEQVFGALCAKAYPIVSRPRPGPVKPPGALHAACANGDLEAVRSILLQMSHSPASTGDARPSTTFGETVDARLRSNSTARAPETVPRNSAGSDFSGFSRGFLNPLPSVKHSTEETDEVRSERLLAGD